MRDGEQIEDLLTRLMHSVVDATFDTVTSIIQRRKVYVKVIEAFQDAGWAHEMECLGSDEAYEKALRQLWRKQGDSRLKDLYENGEV